MFTLGEESPHEQREEPCRCQSHEVGYNYLAFGDCIHPGTTSRGVVKQFEETYTPQRDKDVRREQEKRGQERLDAYLGEKYGIRRSRGCDISVSGQFSPREISHRRNGSEDSKTLSSGIMMIL